MYSQYFGVHACHSSRYLDNLCIYTTKRRRVLINEAWLDKEILRVVPLLVFTFSILFFPTIKTRRVVIVDSGPSSVSM